MAYAVSTSGLKSVVEGWLNGGTNNGFAIVGVGTATNSVTWASSENTDTTRQPELVLTYRVPTAGGCKGTATLIDLADTFIQEDSDGNDNFGTDNSLKIRPQSTKRKHALLRFDVDGIPIGATLNAATLKLAVTTNRTLTTSEIHRMVTAWTEGTNATDGAQWIDANGTGTAGTWAAGAFGSGDYNATTEGTITPSTKGVKTADIKTMVQGWQTGAFANNGLVLLTTGTATGDAAYASRENGTPANRPVINVSWSIPPGSPTGVNTLSAGPLLVVEGDKITVKMVLQNTTASAVTNVAPSALTVTASGAGAYSCATLTGPTPASQTVPANGSATFTWTCTTSTAPTVPGNLAFSATASGDGPTTWASSSSESVIVTPALTFKAQVKNPPGVNVATNQADMTLAFPSTQGSVCYVMADGYDANDVDYLRQVDRTTGAVTPATPAAAGTQSIEGMTWSLDFTTLYAANANQFGTLNTTTGLFSAKASTIASATDPMQGEFGAITVADVDGISFDPATGVLYGVSRREGTNTQLDVLIKIDPVTGKHINSAFGAGVDYIKIRTDLLAIPLYEIDDISFDPVSGSLYAIANGTSASPSVGDRLVTINKSTGAVTDVARITKSGRQPGRRRGPELLRRRRPLRHLWLPRRHGRHQQAVVSGQRHGDRHRESGPGHADHLQRLRGRGLPGRHAQHGLHTQQPGRDRAHRQHRRPRLVRCRWRRPWARYWRQRRAGPGRHRGVRHPYPRRRHSVRHHRRLRQLPHLRPDQRRKLQRHPHAGHHPGRHDADHADHSDGHRHHGRHADGRLRPAPARHGQHRRHRLAGRK